MSSPSLNVLTTNAVDLQQLLTAKKTTSVQLVQAYFAQIDHHEPVLNALISPAPRDKVLAVAAALDEERQRGNIRGQLHGVPIVIKDSFATASSLGMSTTAGSWAFVGAKVAKNSAIVQRLIDAGLIILAKTNMTEFAGMKMTMMMPGWSGHGGQTLSPYVRKLGENETLLGHSAPGGSSTGSAVAVAAGFSPLAMGTETIGSIVTPSTRAGLYALKPTVGVQDTTGVYGLTEFFDSPGPLAKCADDVKILMEILLNQSYDTTYLGSWNGLHVGFLDPKIWNMHEAMCRQYEGTAEQMVQEYEATVNLLGEHGCAVKYPIEIADVSALAVNGEQAIMPIAFWDFKNICMPRFIDQFDSCPVRTVEDVAEFNKEHKDKAMPAPYNEQNDLEKSLGSDETVEHIRSLKEGLRRTAKKILDNAFASQGVNLIVAPGDSSLCIHAAASGYPIATVPVGRLDYNGRPFGLCIVAKENDEESLLRFMSAYEGVAKPRPVPDL